MKLYKEHRVFRHRGDGYDAAVYICFERVEDGMFAVQQMETFRAATAGQGVEEANRIAGTILELFAESDPSERCDWHPSLSEAIAAHDRDFQN